jgi:hypothetical protein
MGGRLLAKRAGRRLVPLCGFRLSADVHDPRLGLCLSRRLRPCWKLKHRRLLAFTGPLLRIIPQPRHGLKVAYAARTR